LGVRDRAPGGDPWECGEKSSTDVPERLNTIAVRLADQGLPREALEILEEAIGIHQKGAGERTEGSAALLSNRGLVRQDLGDLEGARHDLESAREISEEILGPDHPAVARRLAHLGGALLELGEEEKARRLLERAFAILEVNAASPNPDLLLAGLHLGDSLESEPQRARELLERILDEGSKEPKAAAAAHSTLGRIAFREGQFRDARNRFRQAVEIGEKSYKKGHPFVGIDLHNLGLTLRALGSLDKARGVLWRALDILMPRLGADSLRVRRAEEALALVADASTSAQE
jgi:tetratricopeptide (TPR) repeat protein